eukprot:TRINITY_DN32989_c0_g1_i1.p2 TRINITY_DN32989_c0_g1~~TRINITY_DN32989_c0_g1_i1.p2  ORF type:complete len:258 (+),score=49.96 TRINITY_DN32989_c0_g1_i1:127-900(+)
MEVACLEVNCWGLWGLVAGVLLFMAGVALGMACCGRRGPTVARQGTPMKGPRGDALLPATHHASPPAVKFPHGLGEADTPPPPGGTPGTDSDACCVPPPPEPAKRAATSPLRPARLTAAIRERLLGRRQGAGWGGRGVAGLPPAARREAGRPAISYTAAAGGVAASGQPESPLVVGEAHHIAMSPDRPTVLVLDHPGGASQTLVLPPPPSAVASFAHPLPPRTCVPPAPRFPQVTSPASARKLRRAPSAHGALQKWG